MPRSQSPPYEYIVRVSVSQRRWGLPRLVKASSQMIPDTTITHIRANKRDVENGYPITPESGCSIVK